MTEDPLREPYSYEIRGGVFKMLTLYDIPLGQEKKYPIEPWELVNQRMTVHLAKLNHDIDPNNQYYLSQYESAKRALTAIKGLH